MKPLKALVFVMGLLILAGLGLLVYGVVGQISEISGPGPGTAPGAAPGAQDGFEETVVALPAGCSVVETRVDGDRLVVRTDGPPDYGPCQKIIIIDLQSGEVVGRVSIVPQP